MATKPRNPPAGMTRSPASARPADEYGDDDGSDVMASGGPVPGAAIRHDEGQQSEGVYTEQEMQDHGRINWIASRYDTILCLLYEEEMAGKNRTMILNALHAIRIELGFIPPEEPREEKDAS